MPTRSTWWRQGDNTTCVFRRTTTDVARITFPAIEIETPDFDIWKCIALCHHWPFRREWTAFKSTRFLWQDFPTRKSRPRPSWCLPQIRDSDGEDREALGQRRPQTPESVGPSTISWISGDCVSHKEDDGAIRCDEHAYIGCHNLTISANPDLSKGTKK